MKTPALVSIIIPVYNEHSNLAAVLERVIKAPFPSGVVHELIVVNDGSTDGSKEVLDQLRGRVHIHHSIKNEGKGWAIRTGLQYARGDVVAIQDADNEYDPADLQKLVIPLLSGEADVVYGSRFQGSIHGMAFKYWLVNRLLVWMVRILYRQNITDEATAYKAFRREVVERIPLNCRRFEFCPEITAKVSRLGIHIHEVPISYTARTIAQGKKIRLSDAFEAFWTLFRYRFWRGE